MADAREVLEMMREVARTRIDMLKKGITFHDEENRLFYLQEYKEKLNKIDDLIRRQNIRIVRGDDKDKE